MSSFGTQQKRAGGPPINLPEEALVTTVHNYHIMFSKIHANIDIRKIHGYSPLSAIIAPTWGSRVLNWCIIHQHRENEAKNRRPRSAKKPAYSMAGTLKDNSASMAIFNTSCRRYEFGVLLQTVIQSARHNYR